MHARECIDKSTSTDLSDLTRKHARFVRTAECQAAFDRVKETVMCTDAEAARS